MTMVKRATWVIVILVVGWSAGWFLLARGQEKAVSKWFDTRRDKGWQAEFNQLEVSGFPATFARRLEEPRLADPDTGWAWKAPWLDAESPVWLPNSIVVNMPPEQTLAIPGERADIKSERFVVDLQVAPDTALEVRDAGFDVVALEVVGATGWHGGAERATARVTRRPDGAAPEFTYGLDLDAAGVRLPKKLLRKLDPTGVLPADVDRLEIRSDSTLTRQLDRHTLETGDFATRTIVMKKTELRWGKMRLSAQGRIDADAKGFAEGSVTLVLREWRKMVDIARRSGVISRDVARAIKRAIEFKNALFSSDDVRVTLSFGDGKVRIGPLPIADAPRMLPSG